MSVTDFAATPLAAGSPLVPPPERRLGKNPMLPTGGSGDVPPDAEYSAAEAQLRASIGQQYADVLQQLGWVDEGGNFIPGSLSVNAGRQVGNLQRSSDLAAEDVTNEAQRQRTLFSGRRAVDQARAQFPYQQQISQLGVDLPMALGGLYEKASGILDQYTLQNNILLAALAARRSKAIAEQPAGPTTGTGKAPGAERTIPGGEGSTETVFTPEERAAIDASPNALRDIGSDVAQSGGGEYAAPPSTPIWLARIPSDHPLLSDLQQLSQSYPTGPNKAQIKRNML